MVTEDILIRIRAIDEATKVLSKVAGSIKQISSVAPALEKGVDKLTIIKTFKPTIASANILSGRLADLGVSAQFAGVSVRKFNNILRENNIRFVQGIGFIDKFTGKVMDTARVTRMASIQAKRFRFEWLSVMFAGMALSRVFGGLIRTQLELFGVTETLSSVWTVVLLPIMELITPILFKMLEMFMNMPEGMKLAVGAFILIAGALGTILTVVGQVMLAFGGFALLGVTISGIIAFVGAFSIVLTGIILIVKGIFDIFKGKFEGIGLIIMGVGAILLLFIGLWALIPIAVGAAVFLIIKNWTKIKSFFAGVWQSIKKGFIVLWDAIKFVFKGALNFLISGMNIWIRGFENMINSAIKGLNTLIKLINKIPGIDISRIREVNLGSIPSFQKGGIVPDTGLALVHKGEKVIPRSEVNRGAGNNIVFAPVTNIEAVVTSDVDIDRLAEEINRRLAPQFERAVGRGTI